MKQRGFILAEFAIGLPLLMLGLWAMGHLLSSTWTTCRHLIADFTLQMEVRDAMSRIVEDMRAARSLEWDGVLSIDVYYDRGGEIIESAVGSNTARRPIFYYRSTNDEGRFCIYRQRQKNEKSMPITGSDLLSDVEVKKFLPEPIDDRLWRVTIEAESHISEHKFKLMTMVYAEGVGR